MNAAATVTRADSPSSSDDGFVEAGPPAARETGSAPPLRRPRTTASLKPGGGARQLPRLLLSPSSSDDGFVEARSTRRRSTKRRCSLRRPRTTASLKRVHTGQKSTGQEAALRRPRTTASLKPRGQHAKRHVGGQLSVVLGRRLR